LKRSKTNLFSTSLFVLLVFAKTFVSETFVLGTETNYSTKRLFWVGITNCQTAKLKRLFFTDTENFCFEQTFSSEKTYVSKR
jgi:predicted permease